MAYLRFAPKVVDNGYKLTDLDSETIDGKVFTRKLFRHSISVRFNGRDYQATATVVLKRQAGADGEDFVVKSTLLDSGIRDLKNEGNHASYVSWLKIRQDFDSGKKDTVTFEVLMYGKLSMQPLTEMNITGTKLVRESAGLTKAANMCRSFPATSSWKLPIMNVISSCITTTVRRQRFFSMRRRFTMTALRQSIFPA